MEKAIVIEFWERGDGFPPDEFVLPTEEDVTVEDVLKRTGFSAVIAEMNLSVIMKLDSRLVELSEKIPVGKTLVVTRAELEGK